MMLTIGAIIVLGIVAVKILNVLGVNIISILNQLSSLGIWMFAGILILCSFALLFLSSRISISIMNKKEL